MIPLSTAVVSTGSADLIASNARDRRQRLAAPGATRIVVVTMSLQPGGYQFGDYRKTGLPLIALLLALAVLQLPVVCLFPLRQDAVWPSDPVRRSMTCIDQPVPLGPVDLNGARAAPPRRRRLP
jgi:di/tricarboxylate transporter